MIDNYDSFTHNIYQYLEQLGAHVKVVRNDEITLEDLDVRWLLSTSLFATKKTLFAFAIIRHRPTLKLASSKTLLFLLAPATLGMNPEYAVPLFDGLLAR